MAIANKIDTDWAQRQLTAWLTGRLKHAQDVEISEVTVPSGSGMSNETVMFTAAWREPDGQQPTRNLVARVAPVSGGLFPHYDVHLEFTVLQALAEHTPVRVPPVHWYEADPSVLGGPFLVMERIDGRIPADDPSYAAQGWVLELTNDQRARLVDNGLRTLAEIHAVDWKALDLDMLPAGLDAQIARWESFYSWTAQTTKNPTIEAAFAWMHKHRPHETEPTVLNWGDARIGNMIFAEDLSVAGVLDWEASFMCLASPEFDLGWWLFSKRFYIDAMGLAVPPGFPGRDETLARYEQLTGHRPRHVEFYEIFATVRASILMISAARLMTEAGYLPPGNTMASI